MLYRRTWLEDVRTAPPRPFRPDAGGFRPMNKLVGCEGRAAEVAMDGGSADAAVGGGGASGAGASAIVSSADALLCRFPATSFAPYARSGLDPFSACTAAAPMDADLEGGGGDSDAVLLKLPMGDPPPLALAAAAAAARASLYAPGGGDAPPPGATPGARGGLGVAVAIALMQATRGSMSFAAELVVTEGSSSTRGEPRCASALALVSTSCRYFIAAGVEYFDSIFMCGSNRCFLQ